jgi:peptidoglycan/xylan/chitin deacetylase (PgdA/CDA1 family)
MDRKLVMACLIISIFATTGCFVPAAHAEKNIYLTFDMDMNGSMYTKTLATEKKWYDPDLFTYLEQKNIPAAFFASGLFIVAYPELIKDLAATGEFSFENHSYDESSFIPHCYWLATLQSNEEKITQIAETEAIIKQTTGQTATYFRFPGICHNAENDTLVKSLGYTINDGSIIAGDPFNSSTTAMVANILAKATDGGTVLMHVGGPNAPKSLDVLEQIVPVLEAEGYEFKKL